LMKLSLMTASLGQDMTLAELLSVTEKYGYEGLECRAEKGHKHGVELETSREQRAQIKAAFADSAVSFAGIACSCRFEYPEPERRREQVERAKEFIDMCVEVGSPRLRVFGNYKPDDVDEGEFLEYVGASLRELGEYAEGSDVAVNLEMHGHFYRRRYAVGAVEAADHEGIGILYNCDPREREAGPVGETLQAVAPYLRHLHFHHLEDPRYPYNELFRMLKNLGYGGLVTVEGGQSDDAERVIAIYARLFEWMYWNS
jgi:sugar phosphate isomerase/epimerase